jgi:DNA-binding response OmpR family regulator
MQDPSNSVRPIVFRHPTVAVLHENLSSGYRCADWFAAHGYQATLTSLHRLGEQDLRELRPDLIVLGMLSAASQGSQALARVRRLCPQIPIIAMVDDSPAALPDHIPFRSVRGSGADVFMCRSFEPNAAPS